MAGSDEVAYHARGCDKGQRIEDPKHLAALAEVKRAAHELSGRDLLRTLCKSAEPFLRALADRGEPVGPRTQRLLSLLDRYGARELDKAIAAALHVLLPDDPRVRDVRVAQHSLTAYDALSGAAPKEKKP